MPICDEAIYRLMHNERYKEILWQMTRGEDSPIKNLNLHSIGDKRPLKSDIKDETKEQEIPKAVNET